MHVGIDGTWRQVNGVWVGVDGAWKSVSNIYAGIDGAWKSAYSSSSIDSYTKSLLHFNGSDASTTFTDEAGKTWTAYGNAQLDTAQKKFGTASGLFDGTGDYIDTLDSEDFNVGSGDFTIDFWVRVPSLPGSVLGVFGQESAAGTDASFQCLIDSFGQIELTINSDSSSKSKKTSAITVNTWNHVAFVRNSNVLRVFTNGSMDTLDVTGFIVHNSAAKFTIGRLGELVGYNFNGWIDEFRFSKGIARWTSNFTPPTSEY